MNTDSYEKVRRLHKVEKTDFTIVSKPAWITFECPHCGCNVEISWHNVNEPEYWGDDWGEVECNVCGELVELGDYDYD
jgi:transcription elongation factor Elf1